MPDTEPKVWTGEAVCNRCSATNMTRFVDCKTIHGPWALLCRECYGKIGLPIGQEYVLRDGVYYKDQDLKPG